MSSPVATARDLARERSHFANRLYLLDVARGLASLAVVAYHWQHFFMLHGRHAPRKAALLPLLRPLYACGGEIAVSFFFSLSGFVFFWLFRERIESRTCTAWDFAALRIARLYPLHLLTLITVASLQLLHFNLRNDCSLIHSMISTILFCISFSLPIGD